MAWTPSEEYWARKLGAEEAAIDAMKRCLEEGICANGDPMVDDRQREAHEGYLASLKRTRETTQARYRTWRKNRENEERRSIYG